MSNADLIVEYVLTYAELIKNMNTGYATKNVAKREERLRAELLRRRIIDEEHNEILGK